jgi:hypothetical protein
LQNHAFRNILSQKEIDILRVNALAEEVLGIGPFEKRGQPI